MDTHLLSWLLHLIGIWPEACVAARARQGGSSPESSDKWMTTLFFFWRFYFAKAADLMEQKKHVQCLWVFCSLLVLGSEGETAALQRGLQAVLQAGFLTPCLMMALENWCYASPGMLTHSTLGSLERSWACLCVVLWSQEIMLIVPVTQEYWTEQKWSQWAPRCGYGPILLLHLSFWLCWRCTIKPHLPAGKNPAASLLLSCCLEELALSFSHPWRDRLFTILSCLWFSATSLFNAKH